ncbi:tRNA1(Val) (adenine(37)-N6)-methyltransferase [Desulfurispira natronophila]|uniref:tRNA1Val (Adenine37-N6)-methyltransferase n=1 Tax=Desulfurispira natronophila TaxID=682562 RepID=A0A7W7Y4A4_9BACT|nr:methyltransferase [Desulfurispira natronophila]MBB5021823.1 tRNA1Val (adenine37-N6)-methyltransferase [Desulfurispira natronophila]
MKNDHSTLDTIYSPQLTIRQSTHGYRFGIDPVVLAHFTPVTSHKRVLDIGTGAGVIPLLLNYLYGVTRFHAVELQPCLAQLARENFQRHQLEVELFQGNFLEFSCPQKFHHIFSNPPFRRSKSGQHATGQRRLARHESVMELEQMISRGAELLEKSGRFSLVMLTERFAELTQYLRRYNVEAKRARFVHATASAPSRICLVEGRKGAKPGLTVEEPLIVYQDPHRRIYTPQCLKLLREEE